MKTKKAVSEVVTTVLLILLVIGGIAIIWGFVVPLFNNLSSGQACFNAAKDISIDAEGTCFNATSNNLTLKIAKGADESVNVSKIMVIMEDKKGATITNTTTITIGLNEKSTIELNTTKKDIVRVAIAPIVKVGNKEKPCEKGPYIQVGSC